MSTAVFEEIESNLRQRDAERQAERQEKFEQLVSQLALDTENSPKIPAIERVLSDSGRSVEELKEAVRLANERQEAQRLLATCPEWQSRYESLTRDFEAEQERFEKLHEAHNVKRERLLAEMEDIRRTRPNEQALQEKLWQSDSPAKHAKRADLIKRIGPLNLRRLEIEKQAAEIEAHLNAHGPEKGREVLTNYDHLATRVQEMRAQAESIRAEAETIQTEVDALRRSSWEQ